jgi:hypothetical protein
MEPNFLKISFSPLILSNSMQIKEIFYFSQAPRHKYLNFHQPKCLLKKSNLEGGGFFFSGQIFPARLGRKICQELVTLLKKSKYCLNYTITVLYFYLNCSIILQHSLECIHWTFFTEL